LYLYSTARRQILRFSPCLSVCPIHRCHPHPYLGRASPNFMVLIGPQILFACTPDFFKIHIFLIQSVPRCFAELKIPRIPKVILISWRITFHCRKNKYCSFWNVPKETHYFRCISSLYLEMCMQCAFSNIDISVSDGGTDLAQVHVKK
jgi:hypothetical protein